jgi:hypothetical protein
MSAGLSYQGPERARNIVVKVLQIVHQILTVVPPLANLASTVLAGHGVQRLQLGGTMYKLTHGSFLQIG